MIKIARCHAWGLASLCAATFSVVFGAGVLIYLQLVSQNFQLATSLLIVVPLSTVIGLLLALGIGEQIFEWWCTKPEALHKHVVAISTAFTSFALIGLLSFSPPSTTNSTNE